MSSRRRASSAFLIGAGDVGAAAALDRTAGSIPVGSLFLEGLDERLREVLRHLLVV